MEGINAHFIEQGFPQKERLMQLNRIAITQSRSLAASEHLGALGDKKLVSQ